MTGARSQAAGSGKHRNRRRADLVQVETMTNQQVRRVCTAGSVSALASDPHTERADPAGLAWSAICCTVWHGSITGGAPLYTFYNRRLCWPVQRPAWSWYLGMCWMASGRCDTLQRGAGGIITACAGLVLLAVERVNRGKSPCKALCAVF